jgi:hypothetical protein
MARKKQPESVAKSYSLPKSGMQMGNGGGAIDTSTLDLPKKPEWNGWESAKSK